jgi:hypothetical protein
MIGGDFRQPVVAEIIFRHCARAVIRFQQADEIRGRIRPETGSGGVCVQIFLQRFLSSPARHCEIPGQNVVERWNIG